MCDFINIKTCNVVQNQASFTGLEYDNLCLAVQSLKCCRFKLVEGSLVRLKSKEKEGEVLVGGKEIQLRKFDVLYVILTFNGRLILCISDRLLFWKTLKSILVMHPRKRSRNRIEDLLIFWYA